jgi:hypothetical protein
VEADLFNFSAYLLFPVWRHMLKGSPRGGAALQISPPFVSKRYNDLYKANRSPAPIAAEAVRHVDALFEIERTVNGKTPAQQLAARREKSKSGGVGSGPSRQQRHCKGHLLNYLLNR